MGYAHNVDVKLGESIAKDALKTTVSVKVEGVLANWFHKLEHVVQGAFKRSALAGLAHLTHVYTAWTIFSFFKKYFHDNYVLRDQIMRARVGQTTTTLVDAAIDLLPYGGVVLGWAEMFEGRVSRVWIVGAFETDADFKITRDFDMLDPTSRWRPYLLDAEVTTFSAEVTRTQR